MGGEVNHAERRFWDRRGPISGTALVGKPALFFAGLIALNAFAPSLPGPMMNLPSRPASAMPASEMAACLAPLPLRQREERIELEILSGNVPKFLRQLQPVSIESTNPSIQGRFWITPDYLAIGSDVDYLRIPMTPQTAQRLADRVGCTLPTPKMVDAIYRSAYIKLDPLPIPPSRAMTTVEIFALHNSMIYTQQWATQRVSQPLEPSITAGHKKDIVISNRLTNAPGKVAIYGWHKLNGTPIQPLYAGHTNSWVDYSHGVRLALSTMLVNDQTNTVRQILRDAKLAPLLSDEGVVVSPRYSTAAAWNRYGERFTELRPQPDVRVLLNEPAAETVQPDRPLKLVFYALPNGNSIEQTFGRKPKPGDDWHLGIQHIGAQTRWLREADTNNTWVIAYLEAAEKSWPAWRKKHFDNAKLIRGIVESVAARFKEAPVRLVLSGHSGGGSFFFGYLNSVDQIPDNVERIAFLDSNYAYDPKEGHGEKLARWLESSPHHFLSVLAYSDGVALLDGKPFVSATGGTWYRSQLMQTNLAAHFAFTRESTPVFQKFSALDGRVQFLLKENPERKIFHTMQVERNGFIQAMLSGTKQEGMGYEYFGERTYERWIEE